MFSNISSDDNTLSQAMSTARLHNEALNRYHEMFDGVQHNSNSIRPSLVDARFEHLTLIMDQEKERAERLLSQAFNNNDKK